MTEPRDTTYRMTLSLHVLSELGINLYSNVPAVLAEVVANSWDADATKVTVEIDQDDGRIIITDDGRGMLVRGQVNEINARYLLVGYHRRDEQDEFDEHGTILTRDAEGNSITPLFKRPVMGRKGIGKLSLFAIANEFQVHTAKDGHKAGCIMSSDDIREQIKEESGVYNPRPIAPADVEVERGTRIILTDLKKDLRQAARNLRRRLARRFGIRGGLYNFEVFIDGTKVVAQDRDYFHKVQYLWEYGDSNPTFESQCNRLAERFNRSGEVDSTKGLSLTGWIGTAFQSGDLKEGGKEDQESINKIVLFVREKLAQEDILEEFGEGGVYASYVFGELYVDFLDTDREADIATSSRQNIIEDEPRYIALRSFIGSELKEIQSKWTDLRNRKGEEVARQIPAIDAWFQKLGPDHRRKARAIFGRINQLNLKDDQRKVLLQNGVIAFETLRHKEQLDRLDSLSAQDISAITKIFYDLDDLEATLYHRIVVERLRVINALAKAVDDNALEKVLQEHIFTHLWLLDPGWERATGTVPSYMEKSVAKMFEDVNNTLTPEERASRIDIKYTTAQGKHVIVELKRADRLLSTNDVHGQLDKYRIAFQKVARQHEERPKPIELVCIVGRELREWTDNAERDVTARTLAQIGARVVTYQQLIADSETNYKKFLDRHNDAGRISELVRQISEWEWSNDS